MVYQSVNRESHLVPDTYKQLYFPHLILAYEHNNSSSFGHNFDNLDGSNRQGNQRGLSNIFFNYQCKKMYIVKQDINHFNVSVHKPSHIIWSNSMLPLTITFSKISLLTTILNSSIGMNYSFLLA